MNLIEKIINDRNLSFRDLERKTILNTIIGECSRITKTPTDSQVLTVIKKMYDGNVEINSELSISENNILMEYMPKPLTIDELTHIIKNVINSNGYVSKKDMSKVMSYLSENYKGQYDGKESIKIISNILT